MSTNTSRNFLITTNWGEGVWYDLLFKFAGTQVNSGYSFLMFTRFAIYTMQFQYSYRSLSEPHYVPMVHKKMLIGYQDGSEYECSEDQYVSVEAYVDEEDNQPYFVIHHKYAYAQATIFGTSSYAGSVYIKRVNVTPPEA